MCFALCINNKMEIHADSFQHYVVSPLETITPEELETFKPVHKRYYDEKYLVKEENGKILDTMLRIHTNKLILIYLSKKHDIITKHKNIKSVNFKASHDLTKKKLTGKKKKGAALVRENTKLCVIESEDGDEYPVYAGVQGKLIEVNENIFKDFNLLSDGVQGYIGIILPFLDHLPNLEKSALDVDKYESVHCS